MQGWARLFHIFGKAITRSPFVCAPVALDPDCCRKPSVTARSQRANPAMPGNSNEAHSDLLQSNAGDQSRDGRCRRGAARARDAFPKCPCPLPCIQDEKGAGRWATLPKHCCESPGMHTETVHRVAGNRSRPFRAAGRASVGPKRCARVQHGLNRFLRGDGLGGNRDKLPWAAELARALLGRGGGFPEKKP
jgi:hypothetical protein